MEYVTHRPPAEARRFSFLADARSDRRHEPLEAVSGHRGEDESTSFCQQVVWSLGSLREHADDGIDGAPVASDSTFDALAGGGVPLDDPDSVVVVDCRREAGWIPDECNHLASAFECLFDERSAGSPARTEYGDSHTQRRISASIYLQRRSFDVPAPWVDHNRRYKPTSNDIRTPMTGSSDPPDVTELSAGLSREEAIALRESFDPEEQERISHTVAELLDLLGKTHTMAVLSAFAFAEGPLRFSDLETELEVAPNTLSTRLQDLTEAGLLDREAFDEVPPRVEYTPTERAESLFPVFAHLHHWAIEYEL